MEGNQMKMREALEKCVDLILRFGNAELVETPLEVIIDIEAILKSALSAPARNCDRFNNGDAAWGAFIKEKCKSTEKCATMEMDCAKCAFSWLLAPAEEKEGGEE